jgi:hypothetical protein
LFAVHTDNEQDDHNGGYQNNEEEWDITDNTHRDSSIGRLGRLYSLGGWVQMGEEDLLPLWQSDCISTP